MQKSPNLILGSWQTNVKALSFALKDSISKALPFSNFLEPVYGFLKTHLSWNKISSRVWFDGLRISLIQLCIYMSKCFTILIENEMAK